MGSGPAGIAATMALVAQGHRVTVVDVGNELEANRQAVVDRMRGQSPEEWSDQDLETAVGHREATREAVHSKLAFGSSYSFAPSGWEEGIEWEGAPGFHHSHALGGLSNVWGSSLVPYRQEDIAGWPISIADLEEHYRAVLRFVPSTGIVDDLAAILPLYTERTSPLASSRQAAALFDDLRQNHDVLAAAGVRFGRSRLAIHAGGKPGSPACPGCTLCLTGCPYGLIYSSAETLAGLVRDGRVDYLPGHRVERFESTAGQAMLHGRRTVDGSPFELRAARAFIGSGVLPTAAIALESLGAQDRTIVLRDSQYFIYPLLRFRGVSGVEYEAMHTSAQAFVEINDPGVSEHLVHLQVYGYSGFLHHELNRTFLRFPLRSARFREAFLGRVLIAQGFLHSKESGHLELSLRRPAGERSVLFCRPVRSAAVVKRVLGVGAKLAVQSARLGLVPLIPGVKIPRPGSGYHSGGSFPMSDSPTELETDLLGRLPSHDRVHLVDASVLPGIAATSVTLSVMANAHRIASLAATLDA